MNIATLIEQIKNNCPILFSDSIDVITNNYIYQKSEFSNGIANDLVINQSGTNEGSCKLFAFAKLHNLNQQQTLALFGEHYRGVLLEPDGVSHKNIRQFIKYGWEAIVFQKNISDVLKEKS